MGVEDRHNPVARLAPLAKAGVPIFHIHGDSDAVVPLNGCAETVAALTMTAKNRVVTESSDGKGGTLTVKALSIGGAAQPAGTYTAANAKWIEGKGKVVVQP